MGDKTWRGRNKNLQLRKVKVSSLIILSTKVYQSTHSLLLLSTNFIGI